MSNCPPLTGAKECRTIQIVEPDDTLLVATTSGAADPSLDESGSEILGVGQAEVTVQFVTPKASTDYRFEYLYVDAFGEVNPGAVEPVPIIQTQFGFTVDLAGAPILEGYILRWRVVVLTLTGGGELDKPQRLYVQLPQANLLTVQLINPRSTPDYGFDELRVENLVDPPATQTPIFVQCVAKSTTDFKIAINPTPPTDNYWLTARVP